MGLMFGKYVIGYEGKDGRIEFFMNIHYGEAGPVVFTTKNIENAEKFLSDPAARKYFFEHLVDLPVFDYDWKSVCVCKKDNFIARAPM